MNEKPSEPKSKHESELLANRRTLLEILNEIENAAKATPDSESGSLTLQDLLSRTGDKGTEFLSLILSLPFLQPIPLPGVSSVLGLAIASFGFCQILNKPPWLPTRLLRIHFPSTSLVSISSSCLRLLKRLESFGLKPTGQFFFQRRAIQTFIGTMVVIHGLWLSLPMPIPMTNFAPAVVIFLLTLGALEENIWLIALACVASLANFSYFVLIGLASIKSLELLNLWPR